MVGENVDFNIQQSGAWSGLSAILHHVYDKSLTQSLVLFLKSKNASSILDLGAGRGLMSEKFMSSGFFTSCYDGNPETQTISHGRCGVLDLSKKISLSKYDWVISLEVGEHIPKQYEDVFLQNLASTSSNGIILSWALEGQGGDGHVNERSNDYIKNKMITLGYRNLQDEENILREASSIDHFKGAIMVFERSLPEATANEAVLISTSEINNKLSEIENDGALLNAAIYGREEIIKEAFNKGAKINGAPKMNATPLYLASQYNHTEAVKVLLELGANTEIKADNGISPLYIALNNKNFAIVKLLLDNGANIETTNSAGSTPLYLAAYYGDITSIALLLKHGANKKVIVDNLDVIQRAELYGHNDAVKLLTEGIEVFCSDPQMILKFIDICGEYKAVTNSSLLKKVNLSQYQEIMPLPNNLKFIIDTRDNVKIAYNLTAGYGHEPEMINKMMEFVNAGEIYAEIGANYGDFALQMTKKLGDQGKIYTFEPSVNLFQCFIASIYINSLTNIIAENLVILDEEKEVNFFAAVWGSFGSNVVTDGSFYNQKIISTTLDKYFKGKEEKINVLRIDAEGSECKILKGAENIINSSPDIRLFIEWQTPLLLRYESQDSLKQCLSNLTDKGFIFLDIIQYNNTCAYSNYQLEIGDVLRFEHLEFLAIKAEALQNFISKVAFSINNAECFSTVNRLLFSAAMRGDIKATEKFITKGANIDAIADEGATALYISAKNGHKDVVEYLLKQGANTEIKANNGLTSLHIAMQNKHYDVTKMLLDAGADKESSLPGGYTPLYYASYFGDTYQVALLLKHGANKDVQVGEVGITQAAAQNGHGEVTKLLLVGIEEFCLDNINEQFIEICGKDGFHQN